jgi:outer membrane protein insertion porin family
VGLYHDVARVDITDEENAPESIKELYEEFGNSNYITNSIETLLRYDSRDRTVNPSKGADHGIGVEYAGFGGDIGFIKTTLEAGYYHPLWKRFSVVGHVRGKAGFVKESQGKLLPDYELFFLGGINTVRGYTRDELSPIDDEGNEIGGDQFVQLNLETIFPLIKDVGVLGVLFFDMGALANQEAADPAQQHLGLEDLRESVGAGIRWNSPVGPIRVEYGWKIDKQPGESPGQWEFAFGGAF